MFLASVHHSDYMAHDVSTFRNQDSELPLGIFPPGFFSAFDRFNRRHGTHWADVLIAFCTRYCCSMLIVNISSHCLHRNVISSGMFCWFASSKEPALFPKDMSTATWVLLRVVHPSFALSGLVLGIKDNSPQVCVPSNPVLSVTSISLPLSSDLTLTSREVWSCREKMRPCRLETLFWHSYKSGLVDRLHDGYKSPCPHPIGTCHDQRDVGIRVGS